jgi:hypothetical protein
MDVASGKRPVKPPRGMGTVAAAALMVGFSPVG